MLQKIIKQRELIIDPAQLPLEMPAVLRRVYAARGVNASRELDRSLEGLVSYQDLHGIERAVDLLATAVREQWRILIIGDFDADGATSSALAIRALGWMGAHYVDYLVPNRFEFGYGLTPEIVAVAAASEPDLIVTVDNGISSVRGVEEAKKRGIRVLVTDHHLPGRELPAADAIVNPNQPGDDFPSKALAGVGVIFYVMVALRARLREQGWFEQAGLPLPNLARVLDLVALGTVADVVALDRNNRILVEQGLRRIRAGQASAGILALLQVAGRERERVVAADLGFAVGPRLNAAGRLDDMSLGIECLLSEDPERALTMARELDLLNQDRKEIELQMREQAMLAIEGLGLNEAGLPVGLCLYDPGWHQGVIGILASRIKDRFHRPVIAFAEANDSELKGSARSIAGVHIRDVLDAVAARHPGLLNKFGGHAMAAGLSLPKESFDAFQQAFDEEVSRHVREDDLKGVVHSDGSLGAADLDMTLAEELRRGGPWGQGFPEPLFDNEFFITDRRIVGERHLKMSLRHPDSRVPIDAIAFNAVEHGWQDLPEHLRVAYKLDVNSFRGVVSPQLLVDYMEPV